MRNTNLHHVLKSVNCPHSVYSRCLRMILAIAPSTHSAFPLAIPPAWLFSVCLILVVILKTFRSTVCCCRDRTVAQAFQRDRVNSKSCRLWLLTARHHDLGDRAPASHTVTLFCTFTLSCLMQPRWSTGPAAVGSCGLQCPAAPHQTLMENQRGQRWPSRSGISSGELYYIAYNIQ